MLDLRKAINFKRHKLENGLDLVIIPLEKIPVVCINLAYKVGSKDEAHNNTGFAHLFEHLMFEGSENVKKGEFDKLCSIAGGTNNAYTTYDLTSYTMSLPSHQLELGLWLESDRLFNFEVTEEALSNQKKVVVEEIRQTVENQPYGRWRELMADLAYKKECSYSWEVHGKIEHVQSASLENTQNFFDTFYNPSNACLVLCGDVKESTALPLVEKYFNKKGKSSQPKRNKFVNTYRQAGMSGSFDDSIPLSGVFLSYHFDGFYNEDSFAADILANISGNGKSSRLYKSLVYEKQVASQAGAFTDKRENSSLITFYAIANKAETDCGQLYLELEKELGRLASAGIKEEELDKARNQLVTQIAYEMQYAAGIADLSSNQALFWDDPSRLYTLLEKYHNVSREKLEEFASKTINRKNSVLVNAVPEKQK